MKKRIFPRAVAYFGCAIFALTTAALAQDSEPKDVTVQVRHDSKEAPPVTQEKEPSVIFSLEGGYWSEYNFRGTNLMPGSDGGAFYSATATIPKVGPGILQFQIWGLVQIGDASVNDWSLGEGGAGGSTVAIGFPPTPTTATRTPTTIQTSFHEIDLRLSYSFPLGPVDVTLGNIAFFIDRKAQTFETDVLTGLNGVPVSWPSTNFTSNTRMVGPLPTIEDEQFDRIFIRLSTTKLSKYITPSIVYYQTIYNEGTQPTRILDTTLPPYPAADPSVGLQPNNERNEDLGGWLEAQVAGRFPVGRWLEINPYAKIGVSFGDRTEPGGTNPFSGQPLTGFNHVQTGVELEFHLTRHMSFSPFMAYSYHISSPPSGTDWNEYWGGAKVAFTF